jgi:hypothetical protein
VNVRNSAAARDAWGAASRTLLERPWLYGALLLLGLGLRVFLVPYMGSHDMDTVLGWGRDVREVGLPHAYTGIYFPIEWQLSAAAVYGSSELGVSAVASMKTILLVFDVAAMALLMALLRGWRLDERYSLIYWLHPYFLLFFCLGFVDAHLGFCVLACLVILARWQGSAGLLAAGVPLAVAFLMKPQAIGLVGSVPLLVAITIALNPAHWRENLRPLLLLVAPALLFAAYSLYFDLGGAELNTLANTYAPGELARQSASLTADMTNFWYPVAMILRDDGARIYTVVNPTLDTVGTVGAAAILAGALVAVARVRSVIGPREILFAFLFAAMTVPMVAPHAHSNHLYLGLLLSVVVAAARRDLGLIWPLQGLLLAQFVSILGTQGLGLNQLGDDLLLGRLPSTYGGSDALQLLVVATTVVCWVWLMVGLVRSARGAPAPDHEHLLGQRAAREA